VLRLLTDFRSENPGVTFSVSTVAAAGATYDLRISARPAKDGGEEQVDPLRGAEVLLLTAATHRLTEWDRVPAAALRGERLIALAGADAVRAVVAEKLHRAVGDLPTVITCDDLHSLCAYVGAGAGIAFAAGVSDQAARERGVRLMRLQEGELRYPTCLSYRQPLSPAAAAFRGAVLAKLGFNAAFASPELTAEDYLSLPRQCCLPMGMVLSGYWPVGIARHGLNLVKANEAFFSPKGEGFWGRNYGRNLWLYPAWPLDLSDHRQELEAAGYAFFARIEETLPPNMPTIRRTSDFNWNGSLL
jgi:hypothetical protein